MKNLRLNWDNHDLLQNHLQQASKAMAAHLIGEMAAWGSPASDLERMMDAFPEIIRRRLYVMIEEMEPGDHFISGADGSRAA